MDINASEDLLVRILRGWHDMHNSEIEIICIYAE